MADEQDALPAVVPGEEPVVSVQGEYAGNVNDEDPQDAEDGAPQYRQSAAPPQIGEVVPPPKTPREYYDPLEKSWKVWARVHHPSGAPGAPAPQVASGEQSPAAAGPAAAGGGGGRGFGMNLPKLPQRAAKTAKPPPSTPKTLLVAAHYLSTLDANRYEMTTLAKQIARHPDGPAAKSQMARLALLARTSTRLSKQLHRKAMSVPADVGIGILSESRDLNLRIKNMLASQVGHLPEVSKTREFLEKVARQIQESIDRIMRALAPFLGKKNQAGMAAGPSPAAG